MFSNVVGIDIDPNACHAARLSLSLLGLAVLNRIPEELKIIEAESIAYYLEHPEFMATMDAIVANPPFVTVEGQSAELKRDIATFLGDAAKGRIDLYLAFLKLALDLLKPGGFGLIVLPQNFLIAESARGLRDLLLSQAWIHCLVDLSAVRVFEDVGAYVILLIFQKKVPTALPPSATIVRCQDLVGQALQDVLEDRTIDTSFYSVYLAPQEAFEISDWNIPSPVGAAIQQKFSSLIELRQVAELRQGIISGADDIFIIAKEAVPKGEERIFLPFLGDREMESYTVPRTLGKRFFYPYIRGTQIEESKLRKSFPLTWKYLKSHKAQLEERRTVKTKGVPWWRPSWPREPKNLLRPKIVTPHLVIAPRFALDSTGHVAVSHSPLVFSRIGSGAEVDQLKIPSRGFEL